MIQELNNYNDYIDKFLSENALIGRPCPGEHHFVSAYLVPRLFEINQRIPDYINPDGTKGIIGDIVYYLDHKHQFGIEVKLNIIRLTVGEFNEWIVKTNKSKWPSTFIGIGSEGIALCTWTLFRQAYIKSIKKKKKGWVPKCISSGYGPTKSINLLFTELQPSSVFLKAKDQQEAVDLETSFIEALTNEIDC